MLTGRRRPHSLQDPALLQAVLAAIPHGRIVHGLNGPVNGLEDILLQALGGGGRVDSTPGGQVRLLSPGLAQDGARGRQRTTTAEAWSARREHRKLN